MSTGGAGRAPWNSRRAGLVAIGAAAALIGGCGSQNFANQPRAPAPIEVTARVDSKAVTVSPDRFGAGLVNFTVANLSNSPVRFTIEGTKTTDSNGLHQLPPATPDIEPGGTGSLKIALNQGHYRATGGTGVNLKPAPIDVGPPRATSQNKLLLP